MAFTSRDSGNPSTAGLESVAALVLGDRHFSPPAEHTVDTVYYKSFFQAVGYDIVDNADLLSFVSTQPLTAPDGATALPGTSISFSVQLLRDASQETETFFISRRLPGGSDDKLQATATYSRQGSRTLVRFLVTASQGAWKGARFVDITYDDTTGLRTCRIIA